jgi:hypothetical protein
VIHQTVGKMGLTVTATKWDYAFYPHSTYDNSVIAYDDRKSQYDILKSVLL